MKILLISANREKIPYPVAPLGLLYIAEVLRREDFEVSVLDLCFSKSVSKDIKRAILSFCPDIIGISIRNIDNLSYPGVISYLSDIKDTVSIIKNHSEASIILGGSAFSLFPEEILKYTGCNIGVIGEGERAFVQLAGEIEKGRDDFRKIDNVIWLSGGKIFRNRISHDTDSNFVIKRDLIDNSLYSKHGGMGNIQTKRGCSLNCCYCTYPLLEGKKCRLRSPDTIAKEMETSSSMYDIQHFFVVDNIFNYPSEHAEEMCRSIIKKKLNITWTCFARPDHMSKKLLYFMKEAGCTNIEFGTDALSEEVLTMLQKPFSLSDVFKTAKLCREVGIKSAHYVMFGGPGETLETLGKAFKNIELLECSAVIAMVGIRIYPGTKLQLLAIKEGIIKKDENLLDPCFYLTPEMPSEVLLRKVTEFAEKNSKCIIPGLGIRSSEKMLQTLRRYYKKGPLWGYLGE